jgi:CDP-diacylglycerol--inositol 3-phosphatidyltransferase
MVSVWLYVPNIIGYSRILFACLAFYYIYTDHILFFIFYSLSAVLDIADGHAARALDQCSKFGAILDMVTDRASTTCLIVVLAQFYPKYSLGFLFLIALDIISHFAHIYSSLSRGATSHKAVTADQSWFIRLYYTNRLVLGGLCWGNEGFFLMLYLLHFYTGPIIPGLHPLAQILGVPAVGLVLLKLLIYTPLMAIKQFMNLVQLKQAALDLVEMDETERKLKKK